MVISKLRFTASLFGALLGSPIAAQVTQRVSVDLHGMPGNRPSQGFCPVTPDGRYVAFPSFSSNLVLGDTNGEEDVFVRDRQSGTTDRVSINSFGQEGNSVSGETFGVGISADGRYVAFQSYASNLVPGDTNGYSDIFVRDRQTLTTERVSIASNGAEGNADSFYPSISADGRYVAFETWASNFFAGDTNQTADIAVHDRQTGITELVSVDVTGSGPGNGLCAYGCMISADGRYVVFASVASNLVMGTRVAGTSSCVIARTEPPNWRASPLAEPRQTTQVTTARSPGTAASWRSGAYASNLVAGDTNGSQTTSSCATARAGRPTARERGHRAGRRETRPELLALDLGSTAASWRSTVSASNLVAGDTNGIRDIFVRDRQSGTTERVNLATDGTQANGGGLWSSISASGRYVTFTSESTNLAPGDTDWENDIFIRDRDAAGFVSLCDASTAGVIPCPCSNPPAGPQHGCDNSSATGGAVLSAAGIAYLSMDSLVFTTHGETPTALSIVMQGDASISVGVVYGQGVRCVGGTIIRRLFIKSASAGSITAPEFGAGDPKVSARSAAKGDTIQPGQSRWYLVYYRDPRVLGGCPASSTFNTTQTGRVVWSAWTSSVRAGALGIIVDR